jgi:hypothetical protein
MTITIELSPEKERRLHELAARKGQDVETYAQGLIDRGIDAATSLEEILAPVRKQFEESRMTDEELTKLVQEAREDIWNEKKQGKDA